MNIDHLGEKYLKDGPVNANQEREAINYISEKIRDTMKMYMFEAGSIESSQNIKQYISQRFEDIPHFSVDSVEIGGITNDSLSVDVSYSPPEPIRYIKFSAVLSTNGIDIGITKEKREVFSKDMFEV